MALANTVDGAAKQRVCSTSHSNGSGVQSNNSSVAAATLPDKSGLDAVAEGRQISAFRKTLEGLDEDMLLNKASE